MGVVHQQSWLTSRTLCNSEDLFLTNCLTIRAIGLWAANLLGLEGDKATTYAHALVIDFVTPGPLDIVQKLQTDFQEKGIKISDHRINVMIDRQREAARRQVTLRIWSKKPGDDGWERRTYPRFVVPPIVIPPRLERWLERHKGAKKTDLPLIYPG